MSDPLHRTRTPTERNRTEQAHHIGAHRPLGRSLLCRPQEGASTPSAQLLARPISRAAGRGEVLHGPLTSSPVHHLFGAPLGHRLHGKRLRCPLGWEVSGGVLQPEPAVVPCAPWASAQACMAAVKRAIALRLSQGSAVPGPVSTGQLCPVWLLLRLPPSSCSSHTPLRDPAASP